MKIHFFEEFPTTSNLSKLRFVSWPCTLFLAATSLSQFQSLSKNFSRRHHHIHCVYWPVLSRKEGYWFSPFSNHNSLRRIFDELQDHSVPTMIDAELPTRQNLLLYFTQLIYFFHNRQCLRDFVQRHPHVWVAEYYPQSTILQTTLTFLGLHYDPKTYQKPIIKMLYSSLHHFSPQEFLTLLNKGKQRYGSKFIPALGTISPGIQGNEPKLSPEQLEQDLSLAKKAGLNEVIIFRLGGLNEDYLSRIKKYVSH
ncbi:TPA: hypothetical protein HA241_02675 [Candidatus Woesearchaeota archaeon]|nr:hypothetical protein [Candidatus Woesearchaeota archaeon]